MGIDRQDNMTAKEFLRQYEYADRRVRRLEAEYHDELLMVDAIRSASDNDGMPHGSGISKPTEERALRLADKAMRLVDARREAIAKRQEVFDLINSVDGIEGTLLYERYINLKSWEKVAEACDKSDKWCRTRLHSNALQIVRKILDSSL